MSAEINYPHRNSPPWLAQKCLHWSLPEGLKEAVLGDLEEEFHEKLANRGHTNAKIWYLRQALLTTLTYLKRTQRGMLMFVISLLVFLGMTVMAFVLSGELSMFINIPSLLLVVPPALFFAFAATSKQAFSQGLKLLFDDGMDLSKAELLSAKRMFVTLGNVAMWCGFFGVIIGSIAMASSIEPEIFTKVIGPATAVCLLTLLYGMLIKIPCYLAEQKILHILDNQE